MKTRFTKQNASDFFHQSFYQHFVLFHLSLFVILFFFIFIFLFYLLHSSLIRSKSFKGNFIFKVKAITYKIITTDHIFVGSQAHFVDTHVRGQLVRSNFFFLSRLTIYFFLIVGFYIVFVVDRSTCIQLNTKRTQPSIVF